MNRPNLFHFATSELSQDAFFCWLAKCAEPSVADDELRAVATDFLALLAARSGIELPQPIEKVHIRRQLRNIDFVIEINDSIAILVEDKVGTSEHSLQLDRYLQSARELYPQHKLVPVYIQTYIQPTFQGVKQSGFTVIGRKDLLEILPPDAQDSVLSQFREHLLGIDTYHESFRSGSEWGAHAWKRYFEILSESEVGCDWKYVPNAQGGFFAAYWCWTAINLGELYLQLSQERLSVRVIAKEGVSQSEVEKLYHDALAFPEWTVQKKRKPRKGRTQNLVNLEMEHRKFDADGNILIEKTIQELVSYTKKLERFSASRRCGTS